MTPAYNALAVSQQIDRDRRRNRISRREARLIHALLKGREDNGTGHLVGSRT